MYIHEAVNQALNENNYITRQKAWWGRELKLLPTDTDQCVIIYHSNNKKPPQRGWEPDAEDLVASDWITCN